MIYTVTFNPAIDYIMKIDELVYGMTNRSDSEEIYFGGKGINVSIVLTNLGIENTALGFVAGFTGDALARAVDSMGIKTDFIKLCQGYTRINVKLKGMDETEINAQGPKISDSEVDALYKKLDTLKCNDMLVLAGSVPKTLPQDIYEKILTRLSKTGVRCIVDAAGNLLTNVLKYKPFLIKPNKDELEQLCGTNLDTDEKITDAAWELRHAGAENVLVSLGDKGALLIDAFGKVHRRKAFIGKVINTVGAGDSMIAGFIAGMSKGYEYALLLGTAAGSATAFSSGLATKTRIMEMI